MKEDSLAMAKYKIIYDRSNCTGVAACHIVAKKFWQMNKDDKADLISSIPVGNDIWERVTQKGKVTGFAILNFKKRIKKQNKEVILPLKLSLQPV